MTDYTVRFAVPVEVVVYVSAPDEDAAQDLAFELAQTRLTQVQVPDDAGVAIFGDLDGIGADSVTRAQ